MRGTNALDVGVRSIVVIWRAAVYKMPLCRITDRTHIISQSEVSTRRDILHTLFVSTSSKGMSTYELARKLEMNQPVVWRFKSKIMLAIKSRGNYPIDGQVEEDETHVGGKVKEKRGRSQSTKNTGSCSYSKASQRRY